jgi:signal transduction histidine kinase
VKGPPPHERTAAVLLTFAILAAVVSAGTGLAEPPHLTPRWWSTIVFTTVTCSLLPAALAAFGRVRVRWGAGVFLGATALATVTLPLVSDGPFTASQRPWVDALVPGAVMSCVLVTRVWQAAAVSGVAMVLLHGAVQRSDTGELPMSTVLSDGVYNLTLLSITLVVMLALTNAQARLRAEAASAASSYVRARATEQVSRHDAGWDGLVHDRVLAALETIARSDTTARGAPGDAARGAARDALAQLVEGPSGRDVDAVSLRDQVLEAVLTTHPLAVTRFVDHSGGVAAPVPDRVAQALVMALAEALRNAGAHAYPADEPGTVVVELDHDEEGVRVWVRDEGRGFRPDQVAPTSFGVALSIENRMDAVGGHGRVASTVGVGTTVELGWVPWRRR